MAGLYFHIPFCARRCIYCDFYFVTTSKQYEAFTNALLVEMEYYSRQYAGLEPLDTIYLGGGTPSLLPLEQVHRLLEGARAMFDTSQVSEITFEANPDDLSPPYLRGLRELGVDRLSVGIQSFFEDDLAFMGRNHSAREAAAVISKVKGAGFKNFSVDLIFGVPDQPEENWAANLEKAVRAGAPHLSVYGLTVEERTPLFKLVQRGRVTPLEDERMNERFQFTHDYLLSHGYEHYEISNFARPGFRSQHNQMYWEHRNYIGLGPSAHSFWWRSLPEPRALRWSNVRNLNRYQALLEQHVLPIAEREQLSFDTLANEYLMLRLRTKDGLGLDYFEETYGVDLLTEKVDQLAWLEEEEFIEPMRNSVVRLSTKGRMLCDSVVEKLLISA